MRRVDSLDDPRKKLEEELNRVLGTNVVPPQEQEAARLVVRTQERVAARLAGIADRIRQEDRKLWECLYEIWLAHVVPQESKWVAEETSHLDGYKGDYTGLKDHIRNAISADRALALLGRDTCSSKQHQDLFNAIEKALGFYLGRMAKGQAPLVHLLDVLRESELLGEVAPHLSERVWASVQAQARTQADVTFKVYRDAVAAARSRGVAIDKDLAVAAAFQMALLAEKSANLVGVEVDRMLNLTK